MQKVPHSNLENAPCDRYKVDFLEEEVGRLRDSPLINSYISADITS